MSRKGFVTVDGIRLDVFSWNGSNNLVPILLLHEGLGSISMWRQFPERLATSTGREVIAWSRQGHGASDPVTDARDPAYMHIEACALPAFMDAIGLEEAHLLGHSDGGSIALLAAAWSPKRVASLILEAPHVYVEQMTINSIAKIGCVYARTDLGVKLGRHHADADRIFRLWNNIWLDPRFRDWNIEDELHAISAPTLLIQGLDDEYGTMEQLDRIEAVLPDSRRIELADCGHSPHRDQLNAVLQAVTEFLARRA